MTNYAKSVNYENFIMLCRNCKSHEHGADRRNMQNLMDYESGTLFPTALKPQTFLTTVKKHLVAAAEKAIKSPKLTKEDKTKLQLYMDAIALADSSEQILDCCSKGIEIVRKLMPNLDSM